MHASDGSLQIYKAAYTDVILRFQWHPEWLIAVFNHIFVRSVPTSKWCKGVIKPDIYN